MISRKIARSTSPPVKNGVQGFEDESTIKRENRLTFFGNTIYFERPLIQVIKIEKSFPFLANQRA